MQFHTLQKLTDLQPPLTEAIYSFHATWNSDRDKSKQFTEASVETAKMHIKAGIYDDAATKAQLEPRTPSLAAQVRLLCIHGTYI